MVRAIFCVGLLTTSSLVIARPEAVSVCYKQVATVGSPVNDRTGNVLGVITGVAFDDLVGVGSQINGLGAVGFVATVDDGKVEAECRIRWDPGTSALSARHVQQELDGGPSPVVEVCAANYDARDVFGDNGEFTLRNGGQFDITGGSNCLGADFGYWLSQSTVPLRLFPPASFSPPQPCVTGPSTKNCWEMTSQSGAHPPQSVQNVNSEVAFVAVSAVCDSKFEGCYRSGVVLLYSPSNGGSVSLVARENDVGSAYVFERPVVATNAFSDLCINDASGKSLAVAFRSSLSDPSGLLQIIAKVSGGTTSTIALAGDVNKGTSLHGPFGITNDGVVLYAVSSTEVSVPASATGFFMSDGTTTTPVLIGGQVVGGATIGKFSTATDVPWAAMTTNGRIVMRAKVAGATSTTDDVLVTYVSGSSVVLAREGASLAHRRSPVSESDRHVLLTDLSATPVSQPSIASSGQVVFSAYTINQSEAGATEQRSIIASSPGSTSFNSACDLSVVAQTGAVLPYTPVGGTQGNRTVESFAVFNGHPSGGPRSVNADSFVTFIAELSDVEGEPANPIVIYQARVAPCYGDTNGDCITNYADYTLLTQPWNVALPTCLDGDLNGSGFKEAGDWQVWLTNFGNSCN